MVGLGHERNRDQKRVDENKRRDYDYEVASYLITKPEQEKVKDGFRFFFLDQGDHEPAIAIAQHAGYSVALSREQEEKRNHGQGETLDDCNAHSSTNQRTPSKELRINRTRQHFTLEGVRAAQGAINLKSYRGGVGGGFQRRVSKV